MCHLKLPPGAATSRPGAGALPPCAARGGQNTREILFSDLQKEAGMILPAWIERILEWRAECEARLSPEERRVVEPLAIRFHVDRRLLNCLGRYRPPQAEGAHLIELSSYLFPDELKPVFIHEFAHLVAQALYHQKVGHGWQWQWVMKRFGQEPDRYVAINLQQRRSLAKRFPAMRRQLWLEVEPIPEAVTDPVLSEPETGRPSPPRE